MKKLGASRIYDSKSDDTYLVLPNYQNGVLTGAIKCREYKHKKATSYINSDGQFSSISLIPYDYAVSLDTKKRVILVLEGIRDPLRFLKASIPAVSNMGTKTWSEAKIPLLSDYHHVILAMDSDVPGIKCAREIKEAPE